VAVERSDTTASAIPAAASRKELLLRAVSGLLMAAAAIFAAWWGGAVFAGFWIVAGALIFFEWVKIVWSSPYRILWIVVGILYAAVSALAPIALRASHDFGLNTIIFLFAVVWTTDIAGYVVGRLIGGPKLWPAVSPKKTWSGAIGGLVGAVLFGSAVVHFSGIPVGWVALLAAVLSVVAQGGDLAESAIKRRFGVKDASHIIPGHGGVMDRLDGFIVAALLAVLVGLARAGLDNPGRGLLVW
jgi:phosphatidate cytidylyltransferase